MKGSHRLALALLAISSVSGCQGARAYRSVAVSEPALTHPGETPLGAAESQPAQVVTFADRHPLFAKPREYYENSGSNKASKIAAATVVGIPAGIVGELRQIVGGRPPSANY